MVCNGVVDCPDGIDEKYCEGDTFIGNYDIQDRIIPPLQCVRYSTNGSSIHKTRTNFDRYYSPSDIDCAVTEGHFAAHLSDYMRYLGSVAHGAQYTIFDPLTESPGKTVPKTMRFSFRFQETYLPGSHAAISLYGTLLAPFPGRDGRGSGVVLSPDPAGGGVFVDMAGVQRLRVPALAFDVLVGKASGDSLMHVYVRTENTTELVTKAKGHPDNV